MNCFTVCGDGGCHTLAAMETRHSEVKPRDVLRAMCNGPPVVRQEIFQPFKTMGNILACVMSICIIRFLNEL